MAKKNIFEYKGKVRFTPEKVESSISDSVPSQTTGTPGSQKLPGADISRSKEEQEYFDMLDETAEEALVIDEMFKIIEDMVDEQTRELRIPVDPKKRPSLAEATKSLGGEFDGDFVIIDQKVYDRALNLAENCALGTFGFDPVVAAFAEIGPEGLRVPKGLGVTADNCVDAADVNLLNKQREDAINRSKSGSSFNESDTVPVSAVMDQLDFNNKINTILLMLYFALKGVLEWLVSKFRSLEKVKIIGGVIKSSITNPMRKAIKWLQKQINKMMPGTFDIKDKKEFTESKGKQIRAIGALGKDNFLSGNLGEIPGGWYSNEKRIYDSLERT